MNKTAIYFFSAALILIVAGCSGNSMQEAKPSIAVSIEPLRNIAEQIAGNEYEVETILDRGANPETFDPSMSRRAAVDKSVAFFTIGAFPFEEKLTSSASDNIKTIDVSEGIRRVYGTHTHSNGAECHHEADPHTWTSLKNAKIIAGNMATALSELNPVNSELYKHRLDSLTDVIDALDKKIESQLSDMPSRSFAIWHPSLSYLARDYQLKQISVGQENKEVSPRRMKEVLEQASSEGIRVFFFQKEFDSRQAMTINEHLGSRLVVIDPLDYDWMQQIQTIADELSR
ncbi:MAG: zinc ABC transporter substrate-binding protein [Muribaculaceae bacterium]|nr:zinc ABC transporter substrate-binding protein [Muribaculaceae bacterium]